MAEEATASGTNVCARVELCIQSRELLLQMRKQVQRDNFNHPRGTELGCEPGLPNHQVLLLLHYVIPSLGERSAHIVAAPTLSC